MKQTILILAFTTLSAPFLMAQAQAANLSPLNIQADTRVSETVVVASSRNAAVANNNRPHPKYSFNINRINTSAEQADRNRGKHFIYTTHPKTGFRIKRYVG
ncbi:hypothetical protein SAMN05192560_1659 [Methylobacillus rhizosphaerae]|uniref:Uncharacterized protein n=1 Tax=Methylobacillus rhizosphaerae TaxID=551994 RepID=A0A239A2R2_9PROT|nr:hypothetical protein [Methylobacillus rhizosphaerae]SNR89925.1 hypothetical protein SAMN05192560_1659 [Methylobacillus rhizosphaerae]